LPAGNTLVQLLALYTDSVVCYSLTGLSNPHLLKVRQRG